MKNLIVGTALSLAMASVAQEHTDVITWDQAERCCQVIYEDGVPHEHYIDGKMLIEVYAPTTDDKHTEKIRIVVYNGAESTVDLDVDPRWMAASADDPAHTIITSADADALINKGRKSSGRMGTIGAALQGFGAGMQTRTATVNSSDGTTSTVTYHDPSDDRAARQNAAVQAARRQDYYAQASGSVLRHNTVTRGKAVSGFVYFVRPKGLDKKVPLHAFAMNINNTTYIFPFVNGKIPAAVAVTK